MPGGGPRGPGGGPRGPGAAGAGPAVEAAPALPKKPSKAPAKPVRSWFWVRIPDTKIEGTVWEFLTDDKPALDVSILDTTFGKGDVKAAVTVDPSAAPKRAVAITILEAKRQQNTGIVLGRLRLDRTVVHDALFSIDFAILTQERITLLQSVVLSSDEEDQLRNFEGSVAEVSDVDKFYLAILDVPRLNHRLSAMQFKCKFSDIVNDIRGRLGVVSTGVEAVKSSLALKTVLEYLLAIGNYLNGGTNRGGAYGFRLETLVKADSIKGADNKTTLVDVVANLALTAPGDAKAMQSLATELAPITAAKTESIQQLQQDVEALYKSLRMGQDEMSTQKGSPQEKDKYSVVLGPFYEDVARHLGVLSGVMDDTVSRFNTLVVSYGEDVTTSTTESFFGSFEAFFKAFQKSLARLELERKKAASAAAAAEKAAGHAAGAAGHVDDKPKDKNFVDAMYGAIITATMVGAAKQSRHQRKSSVAASVAAMTSPRGLPSDDVLATLVDEGEEAGAGAGAEAGAEAGAGSGEVAGGDGRGRAHFPIGVRAGMPATSSGAPFRLPPFPTGK